MKTLSALLFIVSFAAQSQSDLDAFLATGNLQAGIKGQAKEQLQSFIQPLTAARLSEHRRLRKVFHRLHSTFLKKYEAYSGFDEIFSSGHYDCLTATALFSHVLDELNYSYDLVETNYHIFLMVHTGRGDVLLETTDRFGGFVTGKDEIAKRTEDYRKIHFIATNSKRFLYQYSFNLYQKISSEKLTGLLYYNKAVQAFNHHDWITSSKLLQQANSLYPSPRCEEFGVILVQTLVDSSLDEISKTDCLARLKNIHLRKSPVLAFN